MTNSILKCTPAPKHGRDGVITLEEAWQDDGVAGRISLCYTPDKEVCTPVSFTQLASELSQQETPSVEAFVSSLLDTFYDTVLPSYVEVVMETLHQDGDEAQSRHKIHLAKSQPGYTLPAELKELYP